VSQSRDIASTSQRSSRSNAALCTTPGRTRAAPSDAVSAGSPPRFAFPSERATSVCPHRTLYPPTAPSPSASPAAHQHPPGRKHWPESNETQSGSPVHPRGHEFSYSIRPHCDQCFRSWHPPLCSPTVLVRPHNRRVNHRVFIICI